MSFPPSPISAKFYHDYRFAGVINQDRNSRLLFEDNEKRQHVIVLIGVKHMLLSNFLKGNIVLDVDCYKISSANIDRVRSCFTEIRNEYYKADGVYDPIIGTEIEDLFLTMDTSYGAELVVICEAVEEADLWFQD